MKRVIALMGVLLLLLGLGFLAGCGSSEGDVAGSENESTSRTERVDPPPLDTFVPPDALLVSESDGGASYVILDAASQDFGELAGWYESEFGELIEQRRIDSTTYSADNPPDAHFDIHGVEGDNFWDVHVHFWFEYTECTIGSYTVGGDSPGIIIDITR